MPNYIKNRIELIGSPEQVKSLVERYSTFFPPVPSKSHDDSLIYKKNGEDYTYGWLDQKTNIFTQRGEESVIGVPNGWEQKFDEQWTRFPDFNKIIPMPESLSIESGSLGNAGLSHLYGISTFLGAIEDAKRFSKMSLENQQKAIEIGKKYKSNLDLYGYKTWYDWACDKWGTKWNASECESISDNIFCFTTAWSGVVELIRLLSANFIGEINYKYSDEDTGSNTGEFKFQQGNITSFHKPENGSKEAYDLAFELRPENKENYKLVDDNYEYIDEE